MNTKSYDKLPTLVSTEMENFTKNKCVLVKKQLTTQNNKSLNCHLNVIEQVKKYGGKSRQCWLLNRSPKFTGNEIYYWSFHSVWETAFGEIFDITIDNNNRREYSTVYFDSVRRFDVINGISFNDILIYINKIHHVYTSSEIGKIYWTVSGKFMRELHAINGEYRFLREEYPLNYKKLEMDYGLQVVDGKIKLTNGNLKVSNDALFNYSLSIAA